MFKNKLGLKIALTILAAVVLTIGSIGYLTFYFSQSFLEQSTIERYTQLTAETMTQIDNYLFERESSAKLLSKSHTPKHFLTEFNVSGESPAHPIEGVIEDLSAFGVDHLLWSSVSLVDVNGVIQASSRRSTIGEKFKGLSVNQFENVLRGNSLITEFDHNLDSDSLTKMYVFPIERFYAEDGKSEYVGALVSYLPLATIEQLALEIKNQIPDRLSDVVGVSLMSKDGLILFAEGLTGHVEGQYMRDYLNTHSLVKNYPGGMGKYRSILTDKENEETIMIHRISQNNERYSNFGGMLSLELNSLQLNKPIFELAFKPFLYVMPVAMLVGVLVFLSLYLIIIRPVRSYIRTIDEIKNGKAEARAQIYSDDEIGKMAHSFNDLTEQLQQSNIVLEKQVQERTLDLQNANASLEKQVQERTDALQNANASLEKQVQERTEELRRTNISLEERVRERTVELEKLKNSLEEEVISRTKELHDKVEELENTNKLMVNREMKMLDLKKELEELKGGK